MSRTAGRLVRAEVKSRKARGDAFALDGFEGLGLGVGSVGAGARLSGFGSGEVEAVFVNDDGFGVFGGGTTAKVGGGGGGADAPVREGGLAAGAGGFGEDDEGHFELAGGDEAKDTGDVVEEVVDDLGGLYGSVSV